MTSAPAPALALARPDPGGKPVSVVETGNAASLQALLAGGSRKPTHVRCSVAGGCSRWWSVDVPQQAASLREVRQYAALKFEELFGEPADTWVIRADWRLDAASVCCAVPRVLIDACNEFAASNSLRVVDVRPAELRLLERLKTLPGLRAARHVRVVVMLDRATAWWCEPGVGAVRASSLRVDPLDPWPRVVQEVQRARAVLPGREDDALDVHWCSAAVPAPPGVPGLRWTQHALPVPLPTAQERWDGITLAAAVGCLP